MRTDRLYLRLGFGILCATGLVVMYLFFQHTDVAGFFGIVNRDVKFIVNKTFRFLANDFMMIGVLYALFYERKYVVFALWVQAAGLVFILLPYLVLKVVFHTGNGPLVSYLHRLALNPTLLLLLIPAFYYQRAKGS
jgi:exosortase F-associated protein